jgi:hypothetical protein
MATVLKGIIRGKTIELEAEPGLPDGQEVSVTVAPATAPRRAFLSEENQRRWEEAMEQVKGLAPGEGLRLAAGAWAEDAEELDEFLEWNRQQRKICRRELEP